MPLRRSVVHALDVIAYTGEVVTLDLRVSSGTYVRAIADALRGHCRTLRRTEVGPFDVADAVAPAEFEPGLLLPESDVLDRVERRGRSGPRADGVNVAREPGSSRPRGARSPSARSTASTCGHRRVIEAARGGAPSSDRRHVRSAPAGVLRQPRRAAGDDRAAARAARGRGRRRRAAALVRRRRSPRSTPRSSPSRSCAPSGRRWSPPARRSGSGGAAAAISTCSSGSASTCGACRSSTTSRRVTSGGCSRTGDVRHAARLLGRPAEVDGVVVLGDQRGGTLGFPTANLAVAPDLLVPAFGIYAGSALGHRAAISIGTNPHYGGTERRIEAFLLDFEGDLYGRAGRRRAVGATARRGGLRVGSGAGRGDRPESPDPGGHPARLAAPRAGVARGAQEMSQAGIFVDMGIAVPKEASLACSRAFAAWSAARSTRSPTRAAPSRRTPAARPAATSAGFRSACRRRRERGAAPPRVGGSARRPIALTPPK